MKDRIRKLLPRKLRRSYNKRTPNGTSKAVLLALLRKEPGLISPLKLVKKQSKLFRPSKTKELSSETFVFMQIYGISEITERWFFQRLIKVSQKRMSINF
jgi:hypothetical protein